ncbi:hypothetical protein LJB92_04135 [Bacteroidales bacterium OttesenSCG-928-M06]|nr:hypothetical protein [Bacteroidales bacterium OttesenSCG-928-M06]
METYEKENKKSGKGKKWIGITLGILVIILAAFIYVRYYFVWGEGVKNGQLNYVVYKGYVFKTYEGKLIQAGLRSGNLGSSIQSNEFEFSVVDKSIAEELMHAGGYEVDLHYKEYLGTLPWRGHSKYVVDSIISLKPRQEPYGY